MVTTPSRFLSAKSETSAFHTHISVSSARDVLKFVAKVCFMVLGIVSFLARSVGRKKCKRSPARRYQGTGGTAGWATNGVWHCLEGKVGSCHGLHTGTRTFWPKGAELAFWTRATCGFAQSACNRRFSSSLWLVTHVLSH